MSGFEGPVEGTGAAAGDDTAVAVAVAETLRVGGRAVAADPRRVQGMVNDLLGSTARTRRAEVDAVVIAAEEGVAEELLDGLDADEALARLRVRGLGDDVAIYAVQVWSYGLGLLEAEQPPSLRTSSDAGAGSPVFVVPVPDGAHLADAPADVVPVVADEDDMPGGGGRRVPVALVAAVVLAVVALVGTALWLGRDNTGSGTEAVAAAEVRSAGSTGAVGVDFPVELGDVGELSRRWEVVDGEVVGTLRFVNDGDETLKGRHEEVVPKGLAATAGDIASEPKHEVVLDDPVIAWDLEVPAGDEVVVTYHVDVPDDTTVEDLRGLQRDQAKAAAYWEERTSKKPTIQLIGLTKEVSEPKVGLTGTTAVGAKLRINDKPIKVDAEGKWEHIVSGLNEGPNPITLQATSKYGVVTTKKLTITYTKPAAPATTEPTVTTDTTTPPRTTGTTTPRSTATTTTTAPKPPPPGLKVTMSAGNPWPYVSCGTNFSLDSNLPLTSIEWQYDPTGTYSGRTSAYFTFHSTQAVTISAMVRTADGQTATPSITVFPQQWVGSGPPPC